MVYPGSIFYEISFYNSDVNSEEPLVELSYGVIFGVIESTIFGITESSKLGEEICFKEDVWLGVSEWNIKGIIEGTMIECSEVYKQGFFLD